MKKIITLTMLLAFSIASFGQQDTASKPVQMQTDYLKKSKRQKTWAWITTGVGVFFIGGALALDNSDPYEEVGLTSNYTAAYVVGGAFIATGIVLFVASAKNKKKANAASVFFDIKKAPMLQQTVIRNQSFPAVGVKIHL